MRPAPTRLPSFAANCFPASNSIGDCGTRWRTIVRLPRRGVGRGFPEARRSGPATRTLASMNSRGALSSPAIFRSRRESTARSTAANSNTPLPRFQARHGLDADGIIGPATLRALNVPVEDRINQLRANLERARWVMDGLEPDFIIVNIADSGCTFSAMVKNSGIRESSSAGPTARRPCSGRT